LVEPRDQARIPWPVVFAKAYALVAAGAPQPRRINVKLHWPHLHELPQSVASIIIERDWPQAATVARRRCSWAGSRRRHR